MYNPGRFTTGPSSAARKTRVDGKSMLPKPKRAGSSDRASGEARRPSNPQRSSSAEPARGTVGGRLSRETSATKIPLNRRSRSQQDRYGQTSMTPLRSSQYARMTATPIGTPAEERQSRTWQTSLDRALAFVTVKDHRPITNMSWQRAEFARVLEGLGARGGAGGGQPALTRPLTITRFVEVCNDLIDAIIRNTKLTKDTYVTKLQNHAKRFLYPGAMSASWLKTVNTLHAFPHALAFIAYILDLVNHIETPVSDEWLYLDKDELACLRRDFLFKSWIRFNDLQEDFTDLDAMYVDSLKQLLGHDEKRVAQLQEDIQRYQAILDEESEVTARAAEERLRGRHDGLLARVRAARGEGREARAQADEQAARADLQQTNMKALDADIISITAEIQQLKQELETQEMSVAERARLLDEVDYTRRVIDSKRLVYEQVSKHVITKETELALWQKRTLESCAEYKQALIRMSARCPDLADLAVDEQELMEPSCAEAVSRAVERLRALSAALAERRAKTSRARAALQRQRLLQLEETQTKVGELKATLSRAQQELESECAREAGEAARWAREREQLSARLASLRAGEDDFTQAQVELDFWEKQEVLWTTKLSEMRDYISSLREELQSQLECEKRKKADVILDAISAWHVQLDQMEAAEEEADTLAR